MSGPFFFTRTVPMTAHLLRSGLLTFALLLLTACTLDVGRSSPSTSAADDHSSSWAVTLQRQSSIAGSGLREIRRKRPALRRPAVLLQPGRHIAWDPRLQRLFRKPRRAVCWRRSGCGSHRRGVQVITLQQALAHSDKLFALRVPDLTRTRQRR